MMSTRAFAPRRTAAAFAAALGLVAASVFGIAAPALAATASDSEDGRRLTSTAGTGVIKTVYGEGSIAPLKLTRSNTSVSLAGRIYYVIDGKQVSRVDTKAAPSLYIPNTPFSSTLSAGTHKLEMHYCPTAAGAACPATYNGTTKSDKSKWITLTNTIDVAKTAPQITISLSNKLLKASDAKSGAKKVNLYAYVSGAGLTGEEAKLQGKMRVFLNGAKIHEATVKQIKIPGTNTLKAAVQFDIPGSKLSKAGTYKVTVEYLPGTTPSAKYAKISKSQFRSIQIVAD